MDRFITVISNPDAWRALIYLLTGAGVALKPDQQNAIISAGIALSGLLHAFMVAKDSKPDTEKKP